MRKERAERKYLSALATEYVGAEVGRKGGLSHSLSAEDGGMQTQTFHYDNLNRLIDAVASGGVGGTYPFEQYAYSTTTGNLSSKAGVSLGYAAQNSSCPAGALSKAHAVTTAGSNTYCYDQNGNMVRRTLGGSVYNLTYDAENHLTGVSGPGVNVSFVYDGDGKRVKADWVGSPNHTIIAYIGNTFEYETVGTTTTVRKYYYAGTTRVAMRLGSTLLWLFGDHLGSTSRVANVDGTPLTNGEQRYKPWGEKRYPTGGSGLPTTYRYTGQRQESGLGPSGGEGLYYYGARWYDPYPNLDKANWKYRYSGCPNSNANAANVLS